MRKHLFTNKQEVIHVSFEGSNWTERVFPRETEGASAVFHVRLSEKGQTPSLSEFANDVYFTSTEKKNLLDALFATLTKPQKTKTNLFFVVWKAKSAKIGQIQNYAVILWSTQEISWDFIYLLLFWIIECI